MIKNSFCAVLILALSTLQKPVLAQSIDVDCSQTQAALAYWRPIRETIREEPYSADLLGPKLIDCLASPNSELRDRIGYELLAFWLRNDSFSLQTKLEIYSRLLANLANQEADTSLRRSFSALILSEVMRSDNLNSFLTAQQRNELLQTTLDAFANEQDYRGLTEEFGWVHPIAHMADVLWRFALHSSFNAEQARLILQGIKNRAGASETAYVFNEGDRLARVVAVIISKEKVAADEIVNWLSGFESPLTMDAWFDAYASTQGMHELHNTKLFLRALADQLQQEEDIDIEVQTKLEELVKAFTAIV